MNIDHLPFAAFALESAVGRERHGGRPHTLTLRLAARPTLRASCGAPMSGNVEIDAGGLISQSLLRAAIVPAEGPGLTITF
jgi:hypothetical protein